MNFPVQRSTFNLQLLARNEGKIKSYESCDDIRAWSHDIGARDSYLREWIKCDMPFCVIPVSTLAGFLRAMTYKGRGRVSLPCFYKGIIMFHRNKEYDQFLPFITVDRQVLLEIKRMLL